MQVFRGIVCKRKAFGYDILTIAVATSMQWLKFPATGIESPNENAVIPGTGGDAS